ncbi:FtsH protease activity modulator HflK, partial [Aeromonas hydrophila]
RVVNPEQYLFSVTNADESLSQATDSALRYVVGHTKMDDVLTTGREKVRQETWQVIDGIIEPYQMGLQIVDVNFLPARPPEEVKDAFDDAISAQEDEQRFIREAEAYAREVEPKARGQVKR